MGFPETSKPRRSRNTGPMGFPETSKPRRSRNVYIQNTTLTALNMTYNSSLGKM